MKILFLDIDGVLNSKNSVIKYGAYDIFDSDAVKYLNHITSITKCKIVISSSWRLFHPLSTLRRMLKKFGIKGQITDTTSLKPDFNKTRGELIQMWLKEHPVDKFVILDDHNDEMENLLNQLVFVDQQHGLQMKDAEKAVQILS